MDFDYQTGVLETILIGIVVILILIAGSYLHARKIQICWKEDDVSSNLEITNSILITLYLTYLVTLYGITQFVPDLYVHTGEWFCFTSKLVLSIGDAHLMGHSFLIAFLKFLVIVHAETDRIRKEMFKKCCTYLNITYGILVVGILNIARPDYVFVFHSSMADRCFGRSGVITSNDNTSSAVNLVQLCNISYENPKSIIEQLLTFARKLICWIDVSFIYLNAANVLEAIFYIRIFMYMNRYE